MKSFNIFLIFLMTFVKFTVADDCKYPDLMKDIETSNSEIVDGESGGDIVDYSDEKECGCDSVVEYVCGDNGVTYKNKCEFFCAQNKLVKEDKIIAIAHESQCDGAES